ncbi:MAG: HAD family phosphatase [Pseudomonadota bacterium]
MIFDMDGLLLDTEKICLDCFVNTRRSFGLPDNPEVFLQCVGLRGMKAKSIIFESLGNGVTIGDFSQAWNSALNDRLKGDIPVKQGVETLIGLLSAKSIPMAVATSTDFKHAQDQLKRTGLLPYFQCVIGGDMVRNHKPDPEIYLRAAGELNFKIRDCFAFEDSDAGTRAAFTSGAKTIQVPDLTRPSDEVRNLGHLIAPDVVSGAIEAGLIARSDLLETHSNSLNP